MNILSPTYPTGQIFVHAEVFLLYHAKDYTERSMAALTPNEFVDLERPSGVSGFVGECDARPEDSVTQESYIT